MSYKFISVCIALFSFVVSFYALSAIKFDKFCQVEKLKLKHVNKQRVFKIEDGHVSKLNTLLYSRKLMLIQIIFALCQTRPDRF